MCLIISEKHSNENNTDVEEIQFNNGETKVVVNAKMFLDINKTIEYTFRRAKSLEQDIKNKFIEIKKQFV